MAVVVGVDAGGTASRAVVTDLSGAVLGRGVAGPGNPSAAGARAAAAIGSALRSALGRLDPASVAAGVVGVAGVSAMADPAVAAAFAGEWAAIGLRCDLAVVGDAVTAFAAGGGWASGGAFAAGGGWASGGAFAAGGGWASGGAFAAGGGWASGGAFAAGGGWASGAVLIAGTGAAAALVDGREITRTADGLGWLLGDEGSGVWLGLQAVRRAARRWSSPLARAVAAHAGAATPDDLVHWAGALPPFGALAPLVCALADAGDPDAADLTADASARLVATLEALEAPDAPVVLAGSLLVADTPVRRGVLTRLATRGTPIGTAGDPALGAARLALVRVT